MGYSQQEYDRNMTGVLFVNSKKQDDKQPDYTGSCEIDGEEYFLSGWKKTAKKSGEKFMSLAFTKKDKSKGSRKNNSRQGSDDFPD